MSNHKQNQEMTDQYMAQAQAEFDKVSQQLNNDAQTESIATAYPAVGTVSFATGIVFGKVMVQLQTDSGERVRFDGQHWGLGFGGGISAGAIVLAISPNQLRGDGGYSVVNSAQSLSMTLWCRGRFVGVFAGAALSIGAMAAGGSGKWAAN